MSLGVTPNPSSPTYYQRTVQVLPAVFCACLFACVVCSSPCDNSCSTRLGRDARGSRSVGLTLSVDTAAKMLHWRQAELCIAVQPRVLFLNAAEWVSEKKHALNACYDSIRHNVVRETPFLHRAGHCQHHLQRH